MLALSAFGWKMGDIYVIQDQFPDILTLAPGFHKHRQSAKYNTLSGFVRYVMYYWPAQPGDPSAIRVASVIGISVCLSVLSVLCSLFSVCYILF